MDDASVIRAIVFTLLICVVVILWMYLDMR